MIRVKQKARAEQAGEQTKRAGTDGKLVPTEQKTHPNLIKAKALKIRMAQHLAVIIKATNPTCRAACNLFYKARYNLGIFINAL